MVRTQIHFTESQAKALKKMAAAKQVSVEELVRQGVEHMLRSSIDLAGKRKRALAVAGRYRSGRRDVSRRHDRHVAEAFGRRPI